MGVFSKWSILEKVEDRLELQILNNPNYPFVKDDDDPNVMIYNDRPPEFYISCIVSVISTVITTVWFSVVMFTSMSLSQGIIFPLALLVYFLYRATQTFKMRAYKVNLDKGTYQFYIGKEIVFEGKLHNMYFRLHERSSTGFPYYEIVLNGYRVSCVSISGFSKNIRKMRELAKGMSKRLTINYFDCKDVSSHHIVHWERPVDIASSSQSLLDDDDDPEDNVMAMPQILVPRLLSSRPRGPPESPVLEEPNASGFQLPTITK